MFSLLFLLLLTEAFVPKTLPPSIVLARRGFALRRSQAPAAESDHTSNDDARWNVPPPLPNTVDPFVILGINRYAPGDQAALKRAYHRQAKAYHPDRWVTESTPEETKRRIKHDFQTINIAYAELRVRFGLSGESAKGWSKTSGGAGRTQPTSWSNTAGGAGHTKQRPGTHSSSGRRSAPAWSEDRRRPGAGRTNKWPGTHSPSGRGPSPASEQQRPGAERTKKWSEPAPPEYSAPPEPVRSEPVQSGPVPPEPVQSNPGPSPESSDQRRPGAGGAKKGAWNPGSWAKTVFEEVPQWSIPEPKRNKGAYSPGFVGFRNDNDWEQAAPPRPPLNESATLDVNASVSSPRPESARPRTPSPGGQRPSSAQSDQCRWPARRSHTHSHTQPQAQPQAQSHTQSYTQTQAPRTPSSPQPKRDQGGYSPGFVGFMNDNERKRAAAPHSPSNESATLDGTVSLSSPPLPPTNDTVRGAELAAVEARCKVLKLKLELADISADISVLEKAAREKVLGKRMKQTEYSANATMREKEAREGLKWAKNLVQEYNDKRGTK